MALVGAYLLLNFIVIADALYQVIIHPPLVTNWLQVLFTEHGNPLMMLGVALLFSPAGARSFGLETGAAASAVKWLARRHRGEPRPHRNTRTPLITAALIEACS